MAIDLLPATLTRKQYGLRLIALFAFFMIGLGLYVAALIQGVVFLCWAVLGWIYAAIGLAAPRLRNAGFTPWFAVLFLVPRLNFVAVIVLFFLREKQPPPSVAPA